ncbi:hypothetical protein G6F57_001992 [Rhizopus arrhizus]|uniref:Uncharacterized protein n=1 Tax=Rhizopus oryzae TaxID=64495 RepID=A0A9P7BL07_RHIOR|nr:hypothetical protein G6F30_012887 [Rhizopus arrhizus]KAG1415079.1 hypothetical protein G6F58_006648 [Rhizopus delemar]KAG0989001.1 hypothetical protein G6F29_001325 [Rhizopus arrhizus]KAG0997717.1 hypothetical protein G6F28_002621 [Rhizopus arrhizus]KAG1015306.1 hypothetical protein G6F27_000172 [Rhizopus arrhizus]
MHEQVKKEKTRTDLDEAQRKRIADNRAQVIQRRNRSSVRWGKNAIIKKYPDGRQEIIIPQVLTPEQEHYQFPPRSPFLKRLATSEKQRPSVEKQPAEPNDIAAYFSEVTNRDRVVSDWVSEVERHSSTKPKSTKTTLKNPTGTSGSNKIQFKSDAGKRWANRIQNTSLQPPGESSKKHYVPRRLLHKQKEPVAETISRIQTMWKAYQQHPQQAIESKIAMTAMAATGERTPMASMVHLLHVSHEFLKIQQQRSADRQAQLQSLLNQERRQRELAEASVQQLINHPSTRRSLASSQPSPTIPRTTRDRLGRR